MATEVGQLILKVDTSDVKSAEAAVERLGDSAQSTTQKTKVFEKQSKAANDAVGGFGRKAAMAGIQVEQLAGQIAMGQNPMRALGVQAADLGFVLGAPLVGAVVGIGAAMASVLIPMLLDAGDSTEELTDKMDELGLKFREMTQAQQYVFLTEFNESLRTLQEESRDAQEEIAELDRRQRRIAHNEAMDADARASALAAINEERNRQQAIIDNNALAVQRMTEALGEETKAERELRKENEERQKAIASLYEEARRRSELAQAMRAREIASAEKHAERIIATGDTEIEAIQRREAEQLAIINDYRARDLISAEQHEEALLQILANGQRQRAELQIAAYEENLNRDRTAINDLMAENDRMMTDIIEQEQKRKEAAAQTTTQLLAFEDQLLKGKSEKQRAGFRLAVNLADAEKRENARSIVSNSYDAAMKAYKALAGIPIVGPALGAAAAGTILAAGVSYAAQSLAGRALGGQVRAGESYVVGERGPEVLTMGTGGRITPNEALGGGGQQVVNKTANVSFNIQANDTSGFDQLLASRRGQIISIINQAMNDQGKAALV